MAENGEACFILYLCDKTMQTDEELAGKEERTICTETENVSLPTGLVKRGSDTGKQNTPRMQRYSLLRQNQIFIAIPQTAASKSATNCLFQNFNFARAASFGDVGELMQCGIAPEKCCHFNEKMAQENPAIPIGSIIYISNGGLPCPTGFSRFFTTSKLLSAHRRHHGKLRNGIQRSQEICAMRAETPAPCLHCSTGRTRKGERKTKQNATYCYSPADTEIQHLRDLLQPIKQTACRLKQISRANDLIGADAGCQCQCDCCSCARGFPSNSDPKAHSNWNSLYRAGQTCEDCGARLSDPRYLDRIENSPHSRTNKRTRDPIDYDSMPREYRTCPSNYPVLNDSSFVADHRQEKVSLNSGSLKDKPAMKSNGIQYEENVCHAEEDCMDDYQKSLLLRFANRKPCVSSCGGAISGKDKKTTEIVWPGIQKQQLSATDDRSNKTLPCKNCSRTPAESTVPCTSRRNFPYSTKQLDQRSFNKSTQTPDGSKIPKSSKSSKGRKLCDECCSVKKKSGSGSSTRTPVGGKEQDIATIIYDKENAYASALTTAMKASGITFQGGEASPLSEIGLAKSAKGISTLDQTVSQSREQRIIGDANTVSIIKNTFTLTQHIEEVTEEVTEITASATVEELCPCECGYFQEGVSSDCSCGCEASSEPIINTPQGDSKNFCAQCNKQERPICYPQGGRNEIMMQCGGRNGRKEWCMAGNGRQNKSEVTVQLMEMSAKASMVAISQSEKQLSQITGTTVDLCCLDDDLEARSIPSDRFSKRTAETVSKKPEKGYEFEKEVEMLQENIKIYKEENENLRALIENCHCLGNKLTEISKQPPIRGTSSGLIAAIEILQSKCTSKDAMIAALAGVLRGSKNLEQISRNLLAPCLQYVHMDFDPCALFVNVKKLVESITTQREDMARISQSTCRSNISVRPETPKISQISVSSAIPEPRNFRVSHEICKCLLVSWDAPENTSNIIGYDITVNGIAVSHVRSPNRTDAMLGYVNTSGPIRISICSVGENDRFSSPVTITYPNKSD